MNRIWFILILSTFLIYENTIAQINEELVNNSDQKYVAAKFEPANGKCLFFIGQDMEAIGGLEGYDGYCDHFRIPAGFTLYTNFSPGENVFGFMTQGNDGIETKANWGAGDTCAKCYTDHPDFKYSLLAIGLSLVDHEKAVANGERDDLIRELGGWIKGLGKRPVFLRIGYEFDGWDWNHYSKKHYLLAWKRIYAVFEEMGVSNVAFVWQSKGSGTNQKALEEWYPGDEWVDWCGYSYFGDPDEEMLTFARRHQKPVFIAEATPVFQEGKLFFDTRLSDPKIAQRAWEKWFIPFLETIHTHSDIIKAFSYINVNWSEQPMWIINPVFQKVDSRIQVNELLSEKWNQELQDKRYLWPDEELWKILGDQ